MARSLGRKQRAFLGHVRFTIKKYPTAKCFVPKNTDKVSDADYLQMIETLESLGYIKVDRTAESYLLWVITLPGAK